MCKNNTRAHTHKESAKQVICESGEGAVANCRPPALVAAWNSAQPALQLKCSPAPLETPTLAHGTRAHSGFRAMRENATGIYVQNLKVSFLSFKQRSKQAPTSKVQEDYWDFIHFCGSLPEISKHTSTPGLLTSPRR